MNELDRTDPVRRLQGPAVPPSRGVDGLSWLYGVALLILAFAVARLWIMPPAGPAPTATPDLAQQIGDLEARVAKLESRGGAEFQAVAVRVGALEQRVAALDHPPAITPVAAAPVAAVAGPDTAGTADPGLASQIGAESHRITALARIEAARLGLEQGRPLGDWPEAPAALARYAKLSPPTMATLRLAFDSAAQAALAANRPSRASDASVWQRALGRLEALVTVREGDQVLLGDPAAGTIAHARHALEAGDLEGAVEALKHLPPAAAAALIGWTAQAQALLDARAALATLAAGV